jgi:hypothetical protein
MGHVRQSYRFSSIAPVPRPRARATSQGPPRPHTSAHFLRPDVLFPRFQGRRIVRTRLSSHADAFATPIRPDAAFSRRLKKFADACESQQIACRYATRGDPGWEPTPDATPPAPPELGPDSGRCGAKEPWKRFDLAREALNTALQGSSLPAIARALDELATILRELSVAVAEQDAAAESPHAEQR